MSQQLKDSLILPSPLLPISFEGDAVFLNELITQQNLQILCKRDDLIHPIISGNKWRKLTSTVASISNQNIKNVISFGGGFSNHIHALGYVCMQLGIKMKAIIRGNYEDNLTPMLSDLNKWGAEIHYVKKDEYKLRHSAKYLDNLSEKHPHSMIVPEGGSSEHCLKGMLELVTELFTQINNLPNASKRNGQRTYIITPVASGGTLAGLINGFSHFFSNRNYHQISNKNSNSFNLNNTYIIGIGVLKGQDYLEELVLDILPDTQQTNKVKWQISHEFHHGGYAKSSSQLTEFITTIKILSHKGGNNLGSNSVEPASQISSDELVQIEKVYSAKMFYAIKEMIKNEQFQQNSRIIALHTGGVQGARIR